MKRSHGFQSVGWARAINLHRRYFKARVDQYGRSYHLKPLASGSHLTTLLVRRIARRNPYELVELKVISNFTSDCYVPKMRRIERATK